MFSSPLSSEKYSELYCMSFNPNVNKEEREESWNLIDLMADYKRMGVPNNLWVSTTANSEYRVSRNAMCVEGVKFQFHILQQDEKIFQWLYGDFLEIVCSSAA